MTDAYIKTSRPSTVELHGMLTSQNNEIQRLRDEMNEIHLLGKEVPMTEAKPIGFLAQVKTIFDKWGVMASVISLCAATFYVGVTAGDLKDFKPAIESVKADAKKQNDELTKKIDGVQTQVSDVRVGIATNTADIKSIKETLSDRKGDKDEILAAIKAGKK